MDVDFSVVWFGTVRYGSRDGWMDGYTSRSAVFRSTGLQFDNDDSAIYFGASQQFHIRFTDGTPFLLQIQCFNVSTPRRVITPQNTDLVLPHMLSPGYSPRLLRFRYTCAKHACVTIGEVVHLGCL